MANYLSLCNKAHLARIWQHIARGKKSVYIGYPAQGRRAIHATGILQIRDAALNDDADKAAWLMDITEDLVTRNGVTLQLGLAPQFAEIHFHRKGKLLRTDECPYFLLLTAYHCYTLVMSFSSPANYWLLGSLYWPDYPVHKRQTK